MLELDGHRLTLADIVRVARERTPVRVEPAALHRVAAARRQVNHAVLGVIRQAVHALELPLLALCGVQRVYVYHDLPVGLSLGERIQRGAPEHAARVVLVLPRVVKPSFFLVNLGQAGIRVQRGLRLCVEFVKNRF